MQATSQHPLSIALVFGTRPEAIKLAPLIRLLRRYPERFSTTTILTAQHREMLDQVLELLSIRVDYDLGIIRPRQRLAEIGSRALQGLDSALFQAKPDFVVVQGDTSTTFFGALSAYYNKVPVAHVEAGLRTHRKFEPYPEEINRQLTSVLTDANLAPTMSARQNLLAEGVPPERIWVTGNTVIDALHQVLASSSSAPHPIVQRCRSEGQRILLVTTHRRENHGNPIENICFALLELAARFPNIVIVFPVHLNPAVRETVLTRLRDHPRIQLIEPLDYVEMVHFMQASYLILTDSGGIQEEAPSLGKPVLVFRETTERPEGVEAGTARLVGTDPGEIVAQTSLLLEDALVYEKMAGTVSPYGDGKASERILQVLEFLAGRAESPKQFHEKQAASAAYRTDP